MNRPPRFITFSGADEETSTLGMQVLASFYPIEYAVLLSPARQGTQHRYPSLSFIESLATGGLGLTLSAHLCGDHSRALLEKGETGLEELLSRFHRVQINTAAQDINIALIQSWADALHVEAVLQCRGAFPNEDRVTWLFDASCGRGLVPAAWPAPPASGAFSGYAGGLSPKNVAAAVQVIGARTANYYLDMESGVRDENDRFSLDLCREVCIAVYGRRS